MIEMLTALPFAVRAVVVVIGIVVGFLLLVDIGLGPALVGLAALVAANTAGWSTPVALVAAGLVVAVSYVAACILKPRGPCLWCKGSPRRGTTSEGYFRNCWLCGGSGQRRRIGSKVLRRNRRFVGLSGD